MTDNPKQLKVFSCSHDGKYIFGMSIVVATSKVSAKKMLKTKLIELKVNNDILGDTIEIEEIDLTKPQVYVLFDGKY